MTPPTPVQTPNLGVSAMSLAGRSAQTPKLGVSAISLAGRSVQMPKLGVSNIPAIPAIPVPVLILKQSPTCKT